MHDNTEISSAVQPVSCLIFFRHVQSVIPRTQSKKLISSRKAIGARVSRLDQYVPQMMDWMPVRQRRRDKTQVCSSMVCNVLSSAMSSQQSRWRCAETDWQQDIVSSMIRAFYRQCVLSFVLLTGLASLCTAISFTVRFIVTAYCHSFYCWVYCRDVLSFVLLSEITKPACKDHKPAKDYSSSCFSCRLVKLCEHLRVTA